MNGEQIDVTTETTDASSAENQTVDTQETQSDGGEHTKDSKVSESVPYERFAEINSKNKALMEKQVELERQLQEINSRIPQAQPTQQDLAQKQQEELVKEQLRKLGFVDQSEVDKKLQQIDEDRKLENSLQQLESKFDGSDGRPKFNRRDVLEFARDRKLENLEDAYKLKYHDSLMDFAIKQASGKIKPVKSETSDGSGSSQAGTTNGDLITAARSGDKQSLLSFIKRQF